MSRKERLEKQHAASLEKTKSIKAELDKLRKEQNRMGRIAARKARNQALFESAGWMMMADLLVSESGLPAFDKGALLGGLMAVANTLKEGPESSHFQEWKSVGDALLTEREMLHKKTEPKSETQPEILNR